MVLTRRSAPGSMAVHLGYAHPTLAAVKILCGAGGRETPDSERVSTDWGTLQFVRALPQVVASDGVLFCSYSSRYIPVLF